MVRTQIQLTEEQARRLKRAAAHRGVSMAELIRQGVDEILSAETDLDRTALKDRALQAAGKFGSGHKDVSARHDSHLAEAYGK